MSAARPPLPTSLWVTPKTRRRDDRSQPATNNLSEAAQYVTAAPPWSSPVVPAPHLRSRVQSWVTPKLAADRAEATRRKQSLRGCPDMSLRHRRGLRRWSPPTPSVASSIWGHPPKLADGRADATRRKPPTRLMNVRRQTAASNFALGHPQNRPPGRQKPPATNNLSEAAQYVTAAPPWSSQVVPAHTLGRKFNLGSAPKLAAGRADATRRKQCLRHR
jgi:hypothetical protein